MQFPRHILPDILLLSKETSSSVSLLGETLHVKLWISLEFASKYKSQFGSYNLYPLGSICSIIYFSINYTSNHVISYYFY